MTPVERTLKLLRDEGYHPEIVERWVPRGIKIDLYGLVDIEALHATHTLYVQVCRDADLMAHLAKHLANLRLEKLVACPSRVFQIWSWKLRHGKGKRKLWSELRYTAHFGGSGVTFMEVTSR